METFLLLLFNYQDLIVSFNFFQLSFCKNIHGVLYNYASIQEKDLWQFDLIYFIHILFLLFISNSGRLKLKHWWPILGNLKTISIWNNVIRTAFLKNRRDQGEEYKEMGMTKGKSETREWMDHVEVKNCKTT